MLRFIKNTPNKKLSMAPEGSVRDAITGIETNSLQMVLVLDADEVLLGIVTNGDVRRYLLNGGSIDEPVSACMNTRFRWVGPGTNRAELDRHFGRGSILPRLNGDGRLVEIILKAPEVHPYDTHYEILWERANVTAADYIEPLLGTAMLFMDRQRLWGYALSKTEVEGLSAEFGVFSGDSINFIASVLQDRGLRIHGFDSFEGLQEDWIGTEMTKGAFDVGGRMPEVLPNVELIKGWFDQTVPAYLAQNPEPFSFIHFDADTYEATALVLKLARDRIVAGTIIVFDEYLGYPNWRNGEYRAWQEFVREHHLTYRYLAFSSPAQAVVRVE